MSIFKLSNGRSATTNGNMDMGGGNLAPIPEGTKVRAIITEAKWDTYEGVRYIKLRWDVADGEYKKRVIFQKIKVFESSPENADRQRAMLAAIDFNAGGRLAKLDKDEPSDVDLASALCNKVMVIRLGVWEMGDKSGNWINAVQSATQQASAPAPQSAPAAPAQDNYDDYIPF